MGSNAYRCAHGNPNPEILDYCDKYGILVMDENRNFNSSADGIKQVQDMVMRDRNHPSVVMYSLFKRRTASRYSDRQKACRKTSMKK